MGHKAKLSLPRRLRLTLATCEWVPQSASPGMARYCPDLSCIGLVTTLGEVVEEGAGVAGNARWGGDLLVAEANSGCSHRS
jgi:hypothetical protein